MSLYRVAVKQMKVCSGLWVVRGKTLEIVINAIGNPVVTNGVQLIGDAFMRLYGIDLCNVGVLNMIYLGLK